jgi:hypothetical protein
MAISTIAKKCGYTLQMKADGVFSAQIISYEITFNNTIVDTFVDRNKAIEAFAKLLPNGR